MRELYTVPSPLITVSISEEERQATVLALARLALSRPGWGVFLSGVAEKLNGREAFESFKKSNNDLVPPDELYPPRKS